MIREMVMPQLAMGMSEGTIVQWMATEGERIGRDAVLLSIETEKVVTDLPAPYSGYLHICTAAGTTVPVEKRIAQVAETETEYRQLLASPAPIPTDRARPADAHASGPAAEPAPAAAAEPARGRPRASGLARKLAAQRALDLAAIVGTGPGGRIVRRDIEAVAVQAPAPAATPVTAATAPGAQRERARIPLTGMRKAIADRMLRAKTQTAQTYVFFEVDVTRLIAARQTLLAREAELGMRISTTAFHVRALALACREVPICNATIHGTEIVVWEQINIGVAVALPGKTEFESGLVVPVLRDAASKGLVAIERELKDLVARAKAGTLTAADTTDGTVTLSSAVGFMPGNWCVATPLLNQPQVLNFQPGSAIQKPVVVDGEIAVRTMLPCGVTFDHRATDGEPVARFNRRLADFLGHPELMLL